MKYFNRFQKHGMLEFMKIGRNFFGPIIISRWFIIFQKKGDFELSNSEQKIDKKR